jgi:transcriptional regulator with XRE-family HTH domain
VKHPTPTGGQLLGHVVDAFRLHDAIHPNLRDAIGKRGQRFLAAGCSVRRPCGVICLLGWVFVGTPACDCSASPKVPQLFQPIVFPSKPSLKLSTLATLSIHAHALEWDRLRPRVQETPELVRAFMRFGALDLAVKTAIFRERAGLAAPPRGELPAWAERKRVGEPVSNLLDRVERASLEKLAERLGLSVTALGRWRRGDRRPKSENLKVLLDVVSEGERDAARAELSRHYALAALYRKVERAFGEPFARELALVHSDVVACHMARPARELATPKLIELADLFDDLTLIFSSWVTPPDTFLRIAAHHAPSWQDDIGLATTLWRMPFDGDIVTRPLAAVNWACELHGNPPIVPPDQLKALARQESAFLVEDGPDASRELSAS